MHPEFSMRIKGFILSLILTFTAFFIIVNPAFFNMDIKTAVILIFSLALLQSIVQLFFFIDVWKEKGALWNLTVFLSTVSIIFIIIAFSIWIINHLNYHMH
jgi:cytochrome o ubiquinol oxidase operon protein cyoD